MFQLNPTQWSSQARLFLGFFGGFATALGWAWFGPLSEALIKAIDAIGPVAAAAGPIMYFGAAVWGLIKNKQGNLLSTAATQVDDKGKRIVENMELANTPTGRALAASGVTPANVFVPAEPARGPLGIGGGMR